MKRHEHVKDTKKHRYYIYDDGSLVRYTTDWHGSEKVKAYKADSGDCYIVEIDNKEYPVEELVAEAFLPKYRNLKRQGQNVYIVHKDGDPKNCNVKNIELKVRNKPLKISKKSKTKRRQSNGS